MKNTRKGEWQEASGTVKKNYASVLEAGKCVKAEQAQQCKMLQIVNKDEDWDKIIVFCNVEIIGDLEKNSFTAVIEAKPWWEYVQEKVGGRELETLNADNTFKKFCHKLKG